MRLFIAGKQRSFYAPTEEAAEQLSKDLRYQHCIGIDLSDPGLTVGEWLSTWLRSRRAVIDPDTWKRYEQLVRIQIVPHIGQKPLLKLRPEQVEAMLGDLAPHYSPRTLHHVRAVLRAALNRAMERGYVVRNAAQQAEGPMLRAGKGRTWTPEQVRRLLDAIRGDRYENVYRVALGTALRQGEVLGLRTELVDAEAGTAELFGQVHARRVKQRTKTEAGDARVIGLTPLAARAIRAELTAQAQRRFLMRERWTNKDGLIFTTDRGNPLDGTAVTKRLHRIIEAAELPWLEFHGLRHTANSLMHSLGVDSKTRSAILGHADIRTTEQVYTHVLPESIRKAMEQYDELLTTLEHSDAADG